MTIVESIIKNNPCYQQGKTIAVKGLMLHSVGCPQPNAQAFIRQWDKSTYTASAVHGIIDGNTGTVYQTLPWTMRGWHAGGTANNTHIGIEMCEPSTIKYTSGFQISVTDKDNAAAVATRTYNSAVELFAKLCMEFGLDPKKDGVIISHSEGYKLGVASGHADPEHLWKGLGLPYTMDGFRADVLKKMNEKTQNVKLPADVGNDFWAAESIRYMISSGLMKGFPDGTFRPDEPVTRAQIAEILYRYIKKNGG